MATKTVVTTIPVGDEFRHASVWTFLDDWRGSDPVHIAITPDGTGAYLTNAGSHNVSVINTATHAGEATVKVGCSPLDFAVTADSTKAYVANADSNSTSVIDTSTNTVTGTVPVGVPGQRSHLLVNINTDVSAGPGRRLRRKILRTMRTKTATVPPTPTLLGGRQRTTATKSILPLLHSCPGGVRKSAIHSP